MVHGQQTAINDFSEILLLMVRAQSVQVVLPVLTTGHISYPRPPPSHVLRGRADYQELSLMILPSELPSLATIT